jgi:LysM repeat protein
MNKKFSTFLLVGFILLTINSIAQNTNYPIRRINGIEYHIYTVQTSEGLFAIGRKFDISADEIIKANPEIKDGLKAGQELLIPISANSVVNTPQEINSKDFIQHIVKNKQTLFAISHKYNVNQEDIEKLNPEIKTGLKEGMILNIPDSAKIKKRIAAEKEQISKYKTLVSKGKEEIITYRVEQSETLYSICKRFNADINEVIRLNPGSDTKISADSELKIPINSNISKLKGLNKGNNEKALKTAVERNKNSEKSKTVQYTENKHIRLAFLLPFMLDQSSKEPSLERFQNFYSGALLAIQSAKEKGISFEIYTYDTDKSEEKITEVLNSPELKTMDLIIGPAFSNQVQYVTNFAKEFKVKTLIPFTSKVPDIENNPYIFQFNPGTESELKYIVELLTGKFKNTHLVFAEIQGISPVDEGKLREEALKSELIRLNKSFTIIKLNSSEDTGFSSELIKNEKNLIIFDTDKYFNVNPYIRDLLSLSSDYQIVLFEQYSWINQIEKKPESIYISPFTSDLDEQHNSEYSDKFDFFFGRDVSNDSPRFDMLGYDLTNYFITYISRFGKNFDTKIGQIHFIPYLQSQLTFERLSNESGFINQRIYSCEEKPDK